MDLFRSRTTQRNKEKTQQKAERAAKSQPPREGETEIDIDSLARVMSTESEVEAAYSLGGSTERSSRSTARTNTVDDILDSDDDNDEIYMDEDDENEDSGLRTSQTWDEAYGNAPIDATSPSATSAPGLVSSKPTMPKGSPTSMKARNASGVEYTAMAVASSALCAVPGKLAKRSDLLGNISDSDSSPATRQRSDASNASTDDDDDASVGSFEGKKKGGSGGHSSEDYTDDEDEGEDGYKPGGYHPVKLGEVYNQRYVNTNLSCFAFIVKYRPNDYFLRPNNKIRGYQEAWLGPLFDRVDGEGSSASKVLEPWCYCYEGQAILCSKSTKVCRALHGSCNR